MSSTLKLSEQNAVDLMNKLMQIAKLCNLVQTVDGT